MTSRTEFTVTEAAFNQRFAGRVFDEKRSRPYQLVYDYRQGQQHACPASRAGPRPASPENEPRPNKKQAERHPYVASGLQKKDMALTSHNSAESQNSSHSKSNKKDGYTDSSSRGVTAARDRAPYGLPPVQSQRSADSIFSNKKQSHPQIDGQESRDLPYPCYYGSPVEGHDPQQVYPFNLRPEAYYDHLEFYRCGSYGSPAAEPHLSEGFQYEYTEQKSEPGPPRKSKAPITQERRARQNELKEAVKNETGGYEKYFRPSEWKRLLYIIDSIITDNNNGVPNLWKFIAGYEGRRKYQKGKKIFQMLLALGLEEVFDQLINEEQKQRAQQREKAAKIRSLIFSLVRPIN